jgi:hypothetical protein
LSRATRNIWVSSLGFSKFVDCSCFSTLYDMYQWSCLFRVSVTQQKSSRNDRLWLSNGHFSVILLKIHVSFSKNCCLLVYCMVVRGSIVSSIMYYMYSIYRLPVTTNQLKKIWMIIVRRSSSKKFKKR